MPQPPSSRELALAIVRRLQHAGHIAYFAGGCVRDQLLNRPPKDYDVATDAPPNQVLRLFPHSQQVGAAFGVILVKDRGRQVEVATFRSDGLYSDGRHPDSVRFSTPQDDAARRDFTCNGLFFDPIANQLHDFVNGQPDIHAKILRAIGDPHRRFAEDHLRLLRAVRFAARLDFQIEPATRAAMDQLQARIELISRERIGEEIRMMLEHPTRAAAISLLATFPILFTEVLGLEPSSAPKKDWPTLSNLPAAPTTRPLALAALLLDLDIPDRTAAIHNLRARLMLSNDESAELLWLAQTLPALEAWESLTKAATKRIMADPRWPRLDLLYRADPSNAEQLLAFSERTASLLEESVAPPPFITGATLIILGVPPGPAFKRWLDTLYDRQLEGEFQSPAQALAAAKTLITNAKNA